jgi:hypothetical protein
MYWVGSAAAFMGRFTVFATDARHHRTELVAHVRAPIVPADAERCSPLAKAK